MNNIVLRDVKMGIYRFTLKKKYTFVKELESNMSVFVISCWWKGFPKDIWWKEDIFRMR